MKDTDKELIVFVPVYLPELPKENGYYMVKQKGWNDHRQLQFRIYTRFFDKVGEIMDDEVIYWLKEVPANEYAEDKVKELREENEKYKEHAKSMDSKQLLIEINHILESGANEIRLIELFNRYASKEIPTLVNNEEYEIAVNEIKQLENNLKISEEENRLLQEEVKHRQ